MPASTFSSCRNYHNAGPPVMRYHDNGDGKVNAAVIGDENSVPYPYKSNHYPHSLNTALFEITVQSSRVHF